MTEFLDQFDRDQGETIMKDSYLGDQPQVIIKHYALKRVILFFVFVILFLMLIIIGFKLWNKTRAREVPDFLNGSLEEVNIWANQHGITLRTRREFSDAPINVVIRQEPERNTLIYRGDELFITVSDWRDPNELIGFPIMTDSDKDEVLAFIDNKVPSNVTIKEEFHETVEIGIVYNITFGPDVSPLSFKRKDSATIFISKGPEQYQKNIRVPDFIDKTKLDVLAWHEEKDFVVPFHFEYVFSRVEPGLIVDVGTSAGEIVARNSFMSFSISRGEQVVMPDFSGTLISEFAPNQYDCLNIVVEQILSDDIEYGRFVSQSIDANVDLSERQADVIRVYFSLGKPFIKDLSGFQENEVAAYFFDEFSARGADITYTVVYDYKAQAPYGTVVKTSKSMEYIGMSDQITVTVSKNRAYGSIAN